MKSKLGTHELIGLIEAMTEDYYHLSEQDKVPEALSYTVSASEPSQVERSARMASLRSFQKPFTKLAFDTRRFNSETTRNPRSNLQNWVRSQPFIDSEMEGKLETLGRLWQPLQELKTTYGANPSWHESYARVLYDTVENTLRIKQADGEVFHPQVAYLEQLMFARYRLSMDEIKHAKSEQLKSAIIQKDEALLKKGIYQPLVSESNSNHVQLAKDGNAESLVNAIFGSKIRRDGERSATRTITITITDHSDA